MALSAAIEPGTSAMELAADIKTYLNEPDKMFRRFRYKDEEGNWQRKWKQKVADANGKVHFIDADPKAYHPGRGVYRSSARNAQRLARTEINMAYRKAEQERWKSFDFVVGYEVKITQNGKHVEDICDCLKGKYRKDFKFMGWHPQCMCYTIPILKTEDEFFDDDEDSKSVNEVEDVPQGFKDWVKNNEERIDKAAERGKLPYFIADNRAEVNRILENKKAEERKGTPQEIAKERHAARKPEDVERIQFIWNRRKEYISYSQNSNYLDVTFNYDNGGLKALHRQHNIDSDKGWYETFVQDIGYQNGHKVILESEYSNILHKKFTEGTWDGYKFELATRKTATDNDILRGLKHCADKKETEIAILYFPNGGFTEDKIQKAIKRYKGYKNFPERTYVDFKRVICITNDGIAYDAPF